MSHLAINPHITQFSDPLIPSGAPSQTKTDKMNRIAKKANKIEIKVNAPTPSTPLTASQSIRTRTITKTIIIRNKETDCTNECKSFMYLFGGILCGGILSVIIPAIICSTETCNGNVVTTCMLSGVAIGGFLMLRSRAMYLRLCCYK